MWPFSRLTVHDVRYGAIFLASVAFSWCGISWGVHNKASDGGRGGAIGVAIAFTTLFARKDLGQKAYEYIAIKLPQAKRKLDEDMQKILPGSASKHSEQTLVLETLSSQLAGILGEVRINSNGQNRQNWWIASASVIGTLAWGFGDWLAGQVQTNIAFFKAHHLMWLFFFG
jgi:hypothetical protein